MQRITEDGYQRTNREVTREPRHSGRYWCWGCDAAKVVSGERCPKCGKKTVEKREKKPLVY
jgi:rRNA maturation endonuclease Nob1